MPHTINNDLLRKDVIGNLCYIGCTRQAGRQPMAHDPDPLEKMRMLAEAGVKGLGGYENILANREHHCNRGIWGFVGAVGAVAVMTFTNIGLWWTLGIAVVVGWAVNAWERRVVRKRIAEMESKRD
jgi:hypothetical protein